MNGKVHGGVSTVHGGGGSGPKTISASSRLDNHHAHAHAHDATAPIFARLVDDGSALSRRHHHHQGVADNGGGGVEAGTRYSAKLLSCPNIAVRCDIVEYL